jgi:hypothetical protein
MTAREAAMSLWENVRFGQTLYWRLRINRRQNPPPGFDDGWTFDTVRAFLMYAVEHPSRRRRTPVDVTVMVDRWMPIVKGLATAHEKGDVDKCEFAMDEHLTPLLAAPIKQVREFYTALVGRLKADPEIPFFVWAAFEGWGDVILKNAPDGDVKVLKTQLAAQIAEMVEEDVKPDLKTAIAGALQWRSSETLEKVKTAVEKGGKARMVGRESCLFLEVAGETVML